METIKTVQDQLAMIDMLDYRLRAVLYDLGLLRKSIEEFCNDTKSPPIATGATLKDVYAKLKKHRGSRANLRAVCRANGINSLEEFIKISPSEFMRNKGIGPKTVQDVREAIESLGIVWSDVR